MTPRAKLLGAIDEIKVELKDRLEYLRTNEKFLEAQRLEQRTLFDIEMIRELGYCQGIENYSRYLSGREVGEAPPCLFDYLPDNAILVVDESHVTIPQLGACIAATVRVKRRSCNTASVCHLRSIIDRCDSMNSIDVAADGVRIGDTRRL